MDKIILDLLKENGRVIIPDFGALIVKQKSPFTVIFNEFLQYNDGALISAVATNKSIERDDAASKTREFTKGIQDKLNAGEEVTLEGIGVLIKSATGKISIKEAVATETPGKSTPPTEQKEAPKTVEFDIEEKKKPAEAPGATSKEPVSSGAKKDLPGGVTPRQKKELPKSAPKKDLPGSTPIKEMPKSAPRTTQNAEPQKTKTVTDTVSETPPITEYYSENGKRNKLSIVIWIIVILIVNGAIIGVFFFNDEIKAIFNKEPKTEGIETNLPEVTPIEEEAPVIDDTLVEESAGEPVIESTPEEVEEPQPSQEVFAGTKYYVVAGVFRVESNADNLVSELRNKGYNSEKFTKIGNMYAVSYDVFPTKREADRLMLKIQRESDPGAWIKIID